MRAAPGKGLPIDAPMHLSGRQGPQEMEHQLIYDRETPSAYRFNILKYVNHVGDSRGVKYEKRILQKLQT
jgi:hypothetical protein